MPTDQLVQRLEAVVARLEKFADKAGVGAGASGAASSAAGGSSPALAAYDAYFAKCVVPFVAAAKKFKETTNVATLTETAFKSLHDLIEAAGVCKKPSAQDLSTFIQPIAKVMQEAEKLPDKRQATWFPFHKAFAEGITALNWIMTTTPKVAIESGVEPADFHLNTILTAAKKLSGDEQANYRAYVSTMKAMLTGLIPFVIEFYKMGLEWNPKGGALSAFKPGGAASSSSGAPEAPEAPAAPDAPADLPPPAPSDLPSAPSSGGGGGAGGLAAVFGQLNSLGENGVTQGLKKVTKDMKSKNMKDAPVLQPKEKSGGAKKSAEPKEKVKKPPSLELKQGTWFCENYEQVAELVIPDVQMKENVYISKCKQVLIKIPDKAKSIQVDSCQKLVVHFKSVVSTFEVVNSSSITIDCEEQCMSFALDKSQGIQVVMSKTCVERSPDIVSSNISASNIVVPGKKEGDDPIEIPLPEQFMTKYDPKTFKITTESIKHSGG